MPPKESTIPGEASKQALTLTIDGIAVDVRWEDNDAVSELLDYVKDAHIVVHTSAYFGKTQSHKELETLIPWAPYIQENFKMANSDAYTNYYLD